MIGSFPIRLGKDPDQGFVNGIFMGTAPLAEA